MVEYSSSASRQVHAAPSFFSSFQATSGTSIQAEVVGDPDGSSFSLANGWPAHRGLAEAQAAHPRSEPAVGQAQAENDAQPDKVAACRSHAITWCSSSVSPSQMLNQRALGSLPDPGG
jgi:hypothetical protein